MARSARKAEVQKLELTWAGELHQKGLREGQEEGRKEGRLAGRVDTGRRMLVKILNRRFGALPTALAERIEGLEDPGLIEELSDRAIEVSDLAEIQAQLES